LPNKSPQAVESNLAWLTFIANAIPSLLLVFALWWYGASVYLWGISIFLLSFFSLYTVITVWKKAEYQFRSLHNLLEALVEGNYSFRGLVPGRGGALVALVDTINALAESLQTQKLRSEENLLLLKKVVDQIDVAIVAWDQDGAIRLINPAARDLLGLREGKGLSLERSVDAAIVLPRFKVMKTGETQVQSLDFGSRRGRFRVYMEEFIAEGERHRLLFLTDVSNILRSEEKKAWVNLIRVLSHEINNSLAPLASLSDSLMSQVTKREQDAELAGELMQGLSIISKRAEALAGFVQSYHKISKLPDPDKAPTALKPLLERLVRLFPEQTIHLAGPDLQLQVDAAQIEQALINLLKNAIDANQADVDVGCGRKDLSIRWHLDNTKVVIQIMDRGSGVSDPQNLFTPFYTTKARGSGIGLVLSQQIIEAHAGHLTLANRQDGPGCVVTIEIPLERDGKTS
jgi:two-component system, NtrC family, nitrogen regulation sensor histidine kinase NtrY